MKAIDVHARLFFGSCLLFLLASSSAHADGKAQSAIYQTSGEVEAAFFDQRLVPEDGAFLNPNCDWCAPGVVVPLPSAPIQTPTPTTDPEQIPVPPADTTPSEDTVPPPVTSSPPSIPPSSQQAFSFDTSLAAGTLLASSTVPAMIGDFFGGGGGSTVTFSPGFLATGVIDAGNNLVFLDAQQMIVPGQQFQLAAGGLPQPDPNGVMNDLVLLQETNGQFVIVDGDLFSAEPTGGTVSFRDSTGAIQTGAPAFQLRQDITEIVIPSTSTRINMGINKFAEGNSAIPRDRLIFNHSFFDNVPLAQPGVSVNRFTPGFEKTFFDQNASIQVQVPFATTLDTDFLFDGNDNLTERNEVVFGDVGLIFKGVLYEVPSLMVSGGLQVTIPTGEDQTFDIINPLNGQRSQFAEIQTESVHVMPYLATLINEDRLWVQSVLQFDFDANGSPFLLNQTPFQVGNAASTLTRVGRLNEASFVFADFSFAYDLYRSREQTGNGLASFAPVIEFHYNRSISDADSVAIATGNNVDVAQFGATNREFELLNMVIGGSMIWKNGSRLSVGYATPIAGGSDKEFDGELRVFYSYHFGPDRRNKPFTRTGTF